MGSETSKDKKQAPSNPPLRTTSSPISQSPNPSRPTSSQSSSIPSVQTSSSPQFPNPSHPTSSPKPPAPNTARIFEAEFAKIREEVLKLETGLKELEQNVQNFNSTEDKVDKAGKTLYTEVLKFEELFTQILLRLDKVEVPTVGGIKGPGSIQCPNARADRKTAIQYIESILKFIEPLKESLLEYKP